MNIINVKKQTIFCEKFSAKFLLRSSRLHLNSERSLFFLPKPSWILSSNNIVYSVEFIFASTRSILNLTLCKNTGMGGLLLSLNSQPLFGSCPGSLAHSREGPWERAEKRLGVQASFYYVALQKRDLERLVLSYDE